MVPGYGVRGHGALLGVPPWHGSGCLPGGSKTLNLGNQRGTSENQEFSEKSRILSFSENVKNSQNFSE